MVAHVRREGLCMGRQGEGVGGCGDRPHLGMLCESSQVSGWDVGRASDSGK